MEPFVMGWLCVSGAMGLASWLVWTSRPEVLPGGYENATAKRRAWREEMRKPAVREVRS